jgi:hypothetical protein
MIMFVRFRRLLILCTWADEWTDLLRSTQHTARSTPPSSTNIVFFSRTFPFVLVHVTVCPLGNMPATSSICSNSKNPLRGAVEIIPVSN